MADAPKILDTDYLDEAYPKMNLGIENANEALTTSQISDAKADEAVATANAAETKADSVQEQFNQVVIEGDSSVEAAQARVDSNNNTFATLKERLDTKEDSFTAQLATNGQKLDDININVDKTLLTIPDTVDRVNAIFQQYSDETQFLHLFFPKDIVLSKELTILRKNTKLEFKGKVTSGNFIGIKITDSGYLRSTVTSYTENTYTLDSNIFEIGEKVKIKGTTVSLYTEITAIDGNTITVADIPNFSFDGTTIYMYKVNVMNVEIIGREFTKSEATTLDDINISGNALSDVKIQANFKSGKGVTFAGVGYCELKNSHFFDTGDSCFLYDVCHIAIEKTFMNRFQHGIRGQYIYGCVITKNKLRTGKSSDYSVGIEISSGSLSLNKANRNTISYNEVINAQKGRVGSGIGGIHLNFNAHDNKIIGNDCINNGIGIYLENYCKDNLIDGNTASKNSGYYGVGILLDWDCSGNTIVNNTCDYNVGSVEADESCGIEVRSGFSTGHVIENTILAGNKCRSNGKAGLYVNGDYVTANSNTVKGNGTNNLHTITADIYSTNCRRSTFEKNIVNSSVAKYGVYFKDPTNINFNGNIIQGISTNISTVLMEGVLQYVKFEKNQVISSASQRRVHLKGTAGAGCKYVYANDNVIDGDGNGYAQLEIDNVDYFQKKFNALIGNTTLLAYQCTNEIVS